MINQQLIKLLMSRLTAQTLRKLVPTFEMKAYRSAEDQKEYIHDLILVILHKRKLSSAILCMNEVNQLLIQIGIPLRVNQLHEIYLYCTYQQYSHPKDTKKKLLAMANQEKRKCDSNAMAGWIDEAIKRNEIKFTPLRSERAVSEHMANKIKKNQTSQLPNLRGTSKERLQLQLQELIRIFQEMEKQRQNSGLIPINFDKEAQEIDIQINNIPYDPELYQLNKQLSKLRIQAEARLARIIDLARDDPSVRRKLEQAIQRFQKSRIQANEKVGRLGAMKAQKRLIQKRQKEVSKLKNMKLNQEEDLIRATNLHRLMSTEQKIYRKIV